MRQEDVSARFAGGLGLSLKVGESGRRKWQEDVTVGFGTMMRQGDEEVEVGRKMRKED